MRKLVAALLLSVIAASALSAQEAGRERPSKPEEATPVLQQERKSKSVKEMMGKKSVEHKKGKAAKQKEEMKMEEGKKGGEKIEGTWTNPEGKEITNYGVTQKLQNQEKNAEKKEEKPENKTDKSDSVLTGNTDEESTEMRDEKARSKNKERKKGERQPNF